MFYQRLHDKFLNLITEKELLDKNIVVQSKILKNSEAIGNPDRKDFPLLKGKEFLMEADFLGAKGQAYTDAPSEFNGLLIDIVKDSFKATEKRALFIAALNAVMRYIYPDIMTIHCKDNQPEECAKEISEFVKLLNPNHIGIIGLQPAILESLVKIFGSDKVSCIDRDEEFKGKKKYDVPILWGDDQETENMFQKASIVLATGSTIVNGSLEKILNYADNYDVPIYFFGTTIAGAARLMGLHRLCYMSA